ncbi:MAG: hypothetical protein ACXWV0_02105 [Flavisolibacter sp.]
MKNTIFLFVAALFISVTASAQSTVDSIRAKYQLLPMPEALTIEKSFPVLGTYQLTAADGSSQNVYVTLDSANKGMVWIEGLPEGKFKAFLKKSPGTYRVIEQKTESGKQIPEGTVYFDSSTSTLSVALGKKYDDADPIAVFNLAGDAQLAGEAEVKVKTKKGSTKSKTKLVIYNASKADQSTTSANLNSSK